MPDAKVRTISGDGRVLWRLLWCEECWTTVIGDFEHKRKIYHGLIQAGMDEKTANARMLEMIQSPTEN